MSLDLKVALKWGGLAWLYALLLWQAYQRLFPQTWLEPIWVWSTIYALIPAAFVVGLVWVFGGYRQANFSLWSKLLLVNGLALLTVSWISLGAPVSH